MQSFQRLSHRALRLVERLVLVVITIATVAAIVEEIGIMLASGSVHLADLLLLFLYMEVLAMVGAYVDSGQLPVRMPIYIAIVALARYLVLDMKDLDNLRILAAAGGALVLALAVLVIRYGHVRFPYEKEPVE
ncbi:MAG: phosphate-starvation-inducible PsiE family protein [Thiohalorhabdus sp.]|uniref:phosphate-starvation-inducible PsiE family protein n=1 Tax=Thiohalorhabdus sp. TaxID=3094134 RepID=UPI00397F9F7B